MADVVDFRAAMEKRDDKPAPLAPSAEVLSVQDAILILNRSLGMAHGLIAVLNERVTELEGKVK